MQELFFTAENRPWPVRNCPFYLVMILDMLDKTDGKPGGRNDPFLIF